jgi:hypothetical protein
LLYQSQSRMSSNHRTCPVFVASFDQAKCL